MFKKVRRYLKSPYYALGNDLMKNHPHWMSDKYYLRVMWKSVMGYPLDLKNPVTFNEKLQWMKLYDRNPQYTLLVDKYRVKDWVSEKIGAQYVIKTLDAWDSIDEIDISNLPNQFVLKCNHDSGGVVICENKENFDFEQAKAKLRKSFEHNFYWDYREWPYKNIKKNVFAEEFKVDSKYHELKDYKFFCFNGEPRILFVASGRKTQNEPVFDFFDLNFNRLNVKSEHPQSEKERIPAKPESFEEMKMLAKELSKGFPQVRIDLYEVDGLVFFGEYTFFHWAGFGKFDPVEWDYKLGEWFEL